MLLKRIYKLIPQSDRRKLVWVMFSVMFRSLLDFCGVAALLPILIMILGNHPDKKKTLLFCVAALLFILFKNVVTFLLTRYKNNYLLDLYKQFSCRLFYDYYHRGLLFLKERGTVRLAHEVNFICYTFSLNILSSLFVIGGEAILLFMMIMALLIWKPLICAILVLVFVPFVFLYVYVIRKKLRLWGTKELKIRSHQSRTVTETFRGYPELEINQAFSSSFNTFKSNMDEIKRNRFKTDTLGVFPDFLLELAVVISLSLLVIFIGGNLKIISGIFALSALRMLPSIRTILGCWTSLQSSSSCVDVLEKGLANDEPFNENANDYPLSFQHVLAADHITFTYPDGYSVLIDFSCTIYKGECVGIRGVSGSGKSTLFNILLGFYPVTKGAIYVDDEVLSCKNIKAWHKLVGYVPQEIFIIQGTLAENIALGSDNINKEKISNVLELAQLNDWVGQLPDGIDTSLGEFGNRMSGGQKQRLGIARALYKDATVLFLDEATSSLDSGTEYDINKALQHLSDERQELTIIIIAHRESSLNFCDRIIDM